MVIYEKKTLKVMFYRLLKCVNEHQIIVVMKEYTLCINGEGLYIRYFEKNELHIKGQIDEVKFSYDKE